MAREIPYGTPRQPESYVRPRPALRFVVPAALAGAMLLAASATIMLTPESWGLRRMLAPGNVVAAHAIVETRCQACHLGSGTAREASDARCLRCHSSATSGTHVHSAHVAFGGGDPAKATSREKSQACSACHVEHRGRHADLRHVGDPQCYACHFKSFKAHPEFAAVKSAAREAPGVVFPHERHLRPDAFAAYSRAGMSVTPVTQAEAACVLCHEPERASRDLQPLSFERHCARCHAQELQLGTEPVAAGLVVLPRAIVQRGDSLPGFPATLEEAKAFESLELQLEDGEVRKKAALHEDPWIVYNRAGLARALEPEPHAQARSALLGERARLSRRLSLYQAPAELDQRALREIETGLVASLEMLRSRQASLAAARDATAANNLVAAVAAAAAASRDEALRGRGAPLAKGIRKDGVEARGLTARELQESKAQLLETLRALRETDRGLSADVDQLVGRLEALSPGETSAEALSRVTAQRESDLRAVRDELRLVESGVRGPDAPPRPLLAGRDKPLREALGRAQLRLTLVMVEPTPLARRGGPALNAALHALWNPCKKCHLESSGPAAPVAAARHSFTRARFAHEPHLRAALGQTPLRCASCHAGIENSAKAEELHLPGLADCTGCHNDRTVSDACLSCHRYHPLEAP